MKKESFASDRVRKPVPSVRLMLGVLSSLVVFLPAKAQLPEKSVEWKVETIGTMKEAMQGGDLSGKADLTTLLRKPHLYAIGPLANLRGEVSVFDGVSFLTEVDSKKNVTLKNSEGAKAAFLVYSYVDKWTETKIPADVRSAKELDTFTERTAKENGIDPAKSFPFVISGTVENLDYHIVDKRDDKPHSMAAHDGVKVKFILKKEKVEMIGFYSTRAHGVFVHHGQNSHLHVRTLGSKPVGGHVDDIRMAALGDGVLKLPAGK